MIARMSHPQETARSRSRAPHSSFPVLLLTALALSTVCRAQNLAQNPGFETGDTSGWSPFGPTTISAQSLPVHSGNFAGMVQNRSASWNGISQSMLSIIQPGQIYNVSVWVRIPSGAAAQTLQLTMKKTDGLGDQYTAIGSGAASPTNWTQLAGQYQLTVSGALSALTLYVEVPTSASSDFYVDDLDVEPATPLIGTNGTSTVTWTDVRQRIDGFGASSAWRSTWSSNVANMFFSTNTGLGLSLLRTRIAPGGTTVENSIMQMARDYGARVWSAPWSPQTSFKTVNANGMISVNGGGITGTPAMYQAYASQLAGYVLNMKNLFGVNLYALSIQNEPDYNTTNYESCVWSAQQIHDFVPYLSAALAASNVASTRIIIPESDIWSGDTALYATAMGDPSVAPLVSIIANHNYVTDNNQGDRSVPAVIPGFGKALWETEVSTFDPFDASMNNAIYWANRIHAFLTVSQLNAWHYWWLSATGGDNSGLASSSDVLAKRGFVLGQFSRFVRPDYNRIGVVTNQGTALVSAFKDPVTSKFAIVAINGASTVVTQTFNLAGFSGVASVNPWITSASLSLGPQPSITVSNSSFVTQLQPLSVTTFVGQAANTPPRPVISSIVVNPTQVTLTINGATGPEYIVLSSTNLTDWEPILTTNPPALPITLVLSNTPSWLRFYRIQLGP